MPVLKRINKNFFKKWTREMAYVLGFFAADGYITVNKRGGQFWCIQITDKRLLYAIRNCLQSEHKISCRRPANTKRFLYRLQIGSIEMCNDLRKLGLSENKTKSLAVTNVPSGYFADFVRGYFDGDGNVWVGLIHRKRQTGSLTLRTMFTSCSLTFLQKLLEKLHKFCLRGGSVYRSKKNYARLQFSVGDSLKLYDFMYNQLKQRGVGNSLFLPRKKKIFEKFKKLKIADVV